MTKGPVNVVGDANAVNPSLEFSQAPKPHSDAVYPKKVSNSQGDAGEASQGSVPLISKFPQERFAEKKMPDDPAWINLLHDLNTMTIMQLRKKYSGVAKCHDSMKQRVKTQGAIVHPEFQKFKDFLRLIGPQPAKRATIDRIDNNDPEYAPGKVRWADKRTQNSNKSDSLVFSCLKTGRNLTASQLAARQKVTPTAIRKRRKQGWTDAEIIAGSRLPHSAASDGKTVVRRLKPYSAPPTAAEIEFRRNREYCEWHRRTHDAEYFIATPLEVQQLIADDFAQFRGESWLRETEARFLRYKLPAWWKQYRNHVNFHALQPFQQAWVLRIDPAQGQKMEFADSL